MGTAACGLARTASPSGIPPSSHAPASSPSPSLGQVLGTASNASGWTAVVTAEPGAQLLDTVTVRGPLTVLGGCVPTLTAWAETPAGARVPTPTPSPEMHCMAIALVPIPAGTSRAFSASLPEPAQPGTYTIQATLKTEGALGPSVPVVTIST